MQKCLKCGKAPVTFIRYSGAHLCKEHFIEFFEKRVKKEVRKQLELREIKKIAVAVSGGKDSTAALFITKKNLSSRNISLAAITVDEGIRGYRDKSISVIRKNCANWGITHHIISFKDFFYTMDEIAKISTNLTDCSYCGVFRRYLLNIKAKEINADVVITGHNLDDTAQSVLMNIARGDVERLARMGPHTSIQKGLIPRMVPLRTLPEKETYLYAVLNRIKFYSGKCPYAERAMRNLYRDILYKLEKNSPGTRHAVVRTYDCIAPVLKQKFLPAKLSSCKLCKEPTTQKVCMACELKEGLKLRLNKLRN